MRLQVRGKNEHVTLSLGVCDVLDGVVDDLAGLGVDAIVDDLAGLDAVVEILAHLDAAVDDRAGLDEHKMLRWVVEAAHNDG